VNGGGLDGGGKGRHTCKGLADGFEEVFIVVIDLFVKKTDWFDPWELLNWLRLDRTGL
jgi:hypothetical protein